MGRKVEKTRAVVTANYRRFFAVWEVGAPYIEVNCPATIEGSIQQVKAAFQRGEQYPGAVHAISTNGDLKPSGEPKRNVTANEYIKDELKAFVDEDGGSYLAEIDGGYLG